MTDALPDMAVVRALEETTFAAWPDLASVRLDGWLLRFAAGHTKRANSVNVVHACQAGLEARIEEAERHYRLAGLTPVFRLTPLAEDALDGLLAARGYAVVEPSLVKTAPMLTGVSRDAGVALTNAPDTGWLDAYRAAAGLDEQAAVTLRAMLARIAGRPVYAVLRAQDEVLGLAMAVTVGGRVGFFDVLTLPAARRRGVARRIMESLIAWSRDEAGATSMWIQVVAANAPARNLYRNLGFRTAYGYHYRVAP